MTETARKMILIKYQSSSTAAGCSSTTHHGTCSQHGAEAARSRTCNQDVGTLPGCAILSHPSSLCNTDISSHHNKLLAILRAIPDGVVSPQPSGTQRALGISRAVRQNGAGAGDGIILPRTTRPEAVLHGTATEGDTKTDEPLPLTAVPRPRRLWGIHMTSTSTMDASKCGACQHIHSSSQAQPAARCPPLTMSTLLKMVNISASSLTTHLDSVTPSPSASFDVPAPTATHSQCGVGIHKWRSLKHNSDILIPSPGTGTCSSRCTSSRQGWSVHTLLDMQGNLHHKDTEIHQNTAFYFNLLGLTRIAIKIPRI